MGHFPCTDFNTKRLLNSSRETGPLPDLVLKLALLNAVLHFHLRTFKLFCSRKSRIQKRGRISLRFSGLAILAVRDIWEISGLIIQICEVANPPKKFQDLRFADKQICDLKPNMVVKAAGEVCTIFRQGLQRDVVYLG
jgi:hypothetical protein